MFAADKTVASLFTLDLFRCVIRTGVSRSIAASVCPARWVLMFHFSDDLLLLSGHNGLGAEDTIQSLLACNTTVVFSKSRCPFCFEVTATPFGA